MRRSVRFGMHAAAVVLLTAGSWNGLPGQTLDRSKPPDLGPPPELDLPRIQRTTLSNGLEIAVVEMHEVPVVDVTLVLDAGSVRDPEDLPGLATFVADMLDEGAAGKGALDIADEGAYLGAQLGTFATYDYASISLHVPKRQLAAALDLMADVALRPDFADEEIARQRELRATRLLQQRDQPTTMASLAFAALVFGDGHPYGRPLIGTEVSIELLQRDRVERFYQSFYGPNRAQLLVVGDITLDEARQLINARFADWAPGSAPPVPQAASPEAMERTFYLVDKPDAAQSVVIMGHVGVAQDTQDEAALQVLNTILGGSFTSRLNWNLRETKGFTYGAGSRFERRRMRGPFRASASVVTAKTDSSLIEFFYELRRIRDEAVPEDELDKAKSYITLRMPGRFETTQGTAARYLVQLLYDLPEDYYDNLIPRIMAVTAADVRRAAREYLDPEHFVVVVVGDRGEIEAGIEALGEGPISLRDMWGKVVEGR